MLFLDERSSLFQVWRQKTVLKHGCLLVQPIRQQVLGLGEEQLLGGVDLFRILWLDGVGDILDSLVEAVEKPLVHRALVQVGRLLNHALQVGVNVFLIAMFSNGYTKPTQSYKTFWE